MERLVNKLPLGKKPDVQQVLEQYIGTLDMSFKKNLPEEYLDEDGYFT